MEKEPMLTPEQMAELEKSRTITDADLLKTGAEYKVDQQGNKFLITTEKQKNETVLDKDQSILIEKLTGDLDSLIGSSVEIDIGEAMVRVGTIFDGAHFIKGSNGVQLRLSYDDKFKSYLHQYKKNLGGVTMEMVVKGLASSVVKNQQLLPESFKQLDGIDFRGGLDGAWNLIIFDKESNVWKREIVTLRGII